MRTRSVLTAAIALILAGGGAAAQQTQQNQQAQQNQTPQQRQGQSQQQMQRDPVPLPDVPEAVVEKLDEEQALDGVEVPRQLRQSMQEGPYRPPNENQPEIRSGERSGAPVADIDDGRELPPEATDADREYYPGQPAAARRGDTDGAITSGGLIGASVRDIEGNEIGTIEDLLLGDRGISHAVIALEEGGGQRVAVPWRDLNANVLNRDVQVSIPMSDLIGSPDYAYTGPEMPAD